MSLTGCHWTTKLYHVTNVEARGPRSRCRQVGFLPGAVKKNLVHACLLALGGLLAIFRVPWLMHTSSWSLSPCSHGSPSLCVSVSASPLFYKDTSHGGLGTNPTPVWPHFNWTNYIVTILFPNEVTFRGTGCPCRGGAFLRFACSEGMPILNGTQCLLV